MRRLLLAITLLALTAEPLAGQDRFVAAFGGATFTAESAPFAGVEAGVGLASNVLLVGSLTYMGNALPDKVRARMEDVASGFQAFSRLVLGQDVTVDVVERMPVFQGQAGIRVLVPVAGAARLFVQAGLGFAHLAPELKFFQDSRDVSAMVGPPLGSTETKPTLGFAGGVRAPLGGAVYVEGRYDFLHVFTDQAFQPLVTGGFNIKSVSAGIGYAF